MKQRGVFLIGAILMGIYYFLFPRGTGGEQARRGKGFGIPLFCGVFGEIVGDASAGLPTK